MCAFSLPGDAGFHPALRSGEQLSTLHHSQGKGTRNLKIPFSHDWCPSPTRLHNLPSRPPTKSSSRVMLLQPRKTSDSFVATLLKWRLYPPAHGRLPVGAKIKLHCAKKKNRQRRQQSDVVSVRAGSGGAGSRGCCCTQGHKPCMAYCVPSRDANYVNLAELVPLRSMQKESRRA